MERITKDQLQYKVDLINKAKGITDPAYNKVGSYLLSGAYGGWQLEKVCNVNGGVNNITQGFISKRELYYQLRAYLDGINS